MTGHRPTNGRWSLNEPKVHRNNASGEPIRAGLLSARPDAPCFRCGAAGWCGHDGRDEPKAQGDGA